MVLAANEELVALDAIPIIVIGTIAFGYFVWSSGIKYDFDASKWCWLSTRNQVFDYQNGLDILPRGFWYNCLVIVLWNGRSEWTYQIADSEYWISSP